jgi:thioredoxin 1
MHRIPSLLVCALFLFFSGCGSPKTESSMVSVLTNKELAAIIDKTGEALIAFDLYADWCAPCRMLAPILDKIAAENRGKITFYRVNVDQVSQAGETFRVSGIPMVVFMKNKETVGVLTGLQPKESYEKIIAENTLR